MLIGDKQFTATSVALVDRTSTLIRLNYTGVSRYNLDTSWDHTDGGASENFNDIIGSINKICILAVCFNGSTNEVTARWNWAGSTRRGHSYRGPYSATVHTSSTSASFSAAGVYNESFGGRMTRTFYSGIIDHTLTESEFQKLCELVRVY